MASGGGGWSTHKRSTFASRWDKSTSKAILQGILDAVTLPGDVYRGEVDPRSDEAIGRAFDLAGTLTLGAGAIPRRGLELRAGMSPPKTLYHGTNASVDEGFAFDLTKSGTATDEGWLGQGIYFSPHEDVARSYGKNIVQARALLKNPFVFPDDVNSIKFVREKGGSEAFTKWAIEQGYDGAISNNTLHQTVVFDPKAIEIVRPEAPRRIRAYHGSPHNYAAERLVKRPDGSTEYLVGLPDRLPDVPEGYEVIKDFPLGRMRSDKIGTGEGAQAYGHGLYNAEREGVAKGYRDTLAAGDPRDNVNSVIKSLSGRPVSEDDIFFEMKRYPGLEALQNDSRIKKDIAEAVRGFDSEANSYSPAAMAAFDRLDRALPPPDPGKMYETEIAANPEDFLDWDKPLSEQSEAVREALHKAGVLTDDGVSVYQVGDRWVADDGDRMLTFDTKEEAIRRFPAKTGEQAYRSVKNIEQWDTLRQAGIPGIRYLDQGSRPDMAGWQAAQKRADDFRAKGHDDWAAEAQKEADAIEASISRNYVVFDDSLISILKKYGVVGPVLAALGLSQALPDRAEASEQQGGGW